MLPRDYYGTDKLKSRRDELKSRKDALKSHGSEPKSLKDNTNLTAKIGRDRQKKNKVSVLVADHYSEGKEELKTRKRSYVSAFECQGESKGEEDGIEPRSTEKNGSTSGTDDCSQRKEKELEPRKDDGRQKEENKPNEKEDSSLKRQQGQENWSFNPELSCQDGDDNEFVNVLARNSAVDSYHDSADDFDRDSGSDWSEELSGSHDDECAEESTKNAGGVADETGCGNHENPTESEKCGPKKNDIDDDPSAEPIIDDDPFADPISGFTTTPRPYKLVFAPRM